MVRKIEKIIKSICPHCKEENQKHEYIESHIGGCLMNPNSKSCPTCKHFKNARDNVIKGFCLKDKEFIFDCIKKNCKNWKVGKYYE